MGEIDWSHVCNTCCNFLEKGLFQFSTKEESPYLWYLDWMSGTYTFAESAEISRIQQSYNKNKQTNKKLAIRVCLDGTW